MPKLLQQAITQHQQGELSQAISLYRQVLHQDEHDLQARHGLAIALSQAQHPQQALQEINQAIAQHPKEDSLHNSKGNILKALGQPQEAMHAYQQALALNPCSSAAHNNIGKLHYESHHYQEALQAFTQALTENPQSFDAWFNQALAYSQLEKYDQAAEAIDKALAIAPKHTRALGIKGEICLQQQQFQAAIDHFMARIAREPEHADSYHRLGQAYLQNQQPDEAIIAFEKTITLDDKHPECYHDLATANLIKGENAKALNYFYRQLEIKPLAQTYYNLGVLLLQQNRLQDAAQYLHYAAEMVPDFLPIHVNLGGLYLKLGKSEKAIKHYQIALTLDPTNNEIKHIIAALKQDQTPEQAPAQYIQHLFDQYANYYDKHLQHLKYEVPQKCRQVIDEETGINSRQWRILDLGCGTGLGGQHFRDTAQYLIGIDLSAEMIKSAEQKNIYDELHKLDVIEALHNFHQLDLIVATDVFTYIGKLDDIFAAAKKALVDGGYFIFSVEAGFAEDYKLQPSVRYAHSRPYLEKLIQHLNFKTVRFDNLVLRQQKQQPVEGYLVLLQKI